MQAEAPTASLQALTAAQASCAPGAMRSRACLYASFTAGVKSCLSLTPCMAGGRHGGFNVQGRLYMAFNPVWSLQAWLDSAAAQHSTSKLSGLTSRVREKKSAGRGQSAVPPDAASAAAVILHKGSSSCYISMR
jgi:hypothetical protein